MYWPWGVGIPNQIVGVQECCGAYRRDEGENDGSGCQHEESLLNDVFHVDWWMWIGGAVRAVPLSGSLGKAQKLVSPPTQN